MSENESIDNDTIQQTDTYKYLQAETIRNMKYKDA